MKETNVPNGSAQCPLCKGRDYEYEKGNFRCKGCGLLVDAIARPVEKEKISVDKRKFSTIM